MQDNKKVVEVTIKSLVDGQVNTFTGRGAVLSLFEQERVEGSEFTAALVGEFNFSAMMHAISNTVSSIVEGLAGKVDPFALEKCVMEAAKDGMTRGISHYLKNSGDPDMAALVEALQALRG